MALTGVNRYVDTSATYNGDGTSPAQATSDGGTGAYNSIQSALSAAPNNPSSESARWLIWVRRLDSGTNIPISSTLSPTNDGSCNAPHMLIGWPYREQKTGMSIDSVPTGTDSLGFNNAQWQFIDSALTEGDNYWVDAIVEFTSGSNSGLSRRVIWFDATNDKIYLDFPLPNDIAAGDGYTITLETHYYDDRPSAAQSLWDSDTNIRPVIDGGGGAYNIIGFYQDYDWVSANLHLKNTSSTGNYIGIAHCREIYNVIIENVGQAVKYDGSYAKQLPVKLNRCYFYNCNRSYWGILYIASSIEIHLEEVHLNKAGGSNYRAINPLPARLFLKNCTFGRVTALTEGLVASYLYVPNVFGENVTINATTPVSFSTNNNAWGGIVAISGYNGSSDKFHQWLGQGMGELYNVDEDDTIDPPSGATTYIKFKPLAKVSSYYPLIHEEQRYQSSGLKTYTWKFYPVNMNLDATDLEVEAWYLDESSGTHRVYATANPSAYDDGGWHDLSITVNPSQAGVVYFKIKLKKYNSSGCYVALDPEVSIS